MISKYKNKTIKFIRELTRFFMMLKRTLNFKNTVKKGTPMFQKFLLETDAIDFRHPEMIKKSL
ncbi:hypothetical protein GH810_03750 [Acetobacterium paludosum]|uniref:Uncharacterized protein n=1 Tax=Acetobacterium paludosum TaxID=52693 RepID=A0A923KWN8_9FIRM|nr:hypothetical protein [Acetobacterium paludosum]MBC3887421.1 hypothetical protein [Acetobacterium paludosum]